MLAAAVAAALATVALHHAGLLDMGPPPNAQDPARLALDALMAEFAGDGGGVTRRLAATLALRRRGRVATVYHHIQKSGGSSHCRALAESNATLLSCKRPGVAASPGDSALSCNCNAPLPLAANPLAVGSRRQVEAFLRAHAWVDVLQSEAGLADDPYFGPAAVQVAVLRHPVARCVSHLLHYRVARRPTREERDAERAAARPLTPEYVAAEVAHVVAQLAGPPGLEAYRHARHVDNFMTRFFAGGASRYPPVVYRNATVFDPALHTPMPPITEAVFQRALANLASLDAVLLLEEAGTPHAAALLTALGLRSFVPEKRAGTHFSAGAAGRGGAYAAVLTPAVRRQVADWNKWDLLLYSFAELRHRQLIAAWAKLERERGQT